MEFLNCHHKQKIPCYFFILKFSHKTTYLHFLHKSNTPKFFNYSLFITPKLIYRLIYTKYIVNLTNNALLILLSQYNMFNKI